MSKTKNQNKNNNKSSNVPVKCQPMKPQKGAVIKPNQVATNKINQKTVAKPVAKPIAKSVAKPVAKPSSKPTATKIPESNKKQLKPIKKDADIAESDEDEDEDDVDFDSDIDDVDLGDSGDEDMEDGDDDDLSIEEIDGSDLESFEDGDSNDESEEDDDEPQIVAKKEPVKKVEKKEPAKAVEKKEPAKAVEKKEPAKAVEKKEPVKAVEKKEPVKAVEKKEPVKAVEKKEPVKAVEKKEPVKAVEKKEPVKAVEKKEPVNKVEKRNTPNEENIIDSSTKEGKLLIEINRRKNYFSDVIVFISKVTSDFSRDALTKFLKENKLSIITINLPGKIKKKGLQLRGYGFARFASVEDAKKALDLINSKEINGKRVKASPYVCRKVYDDISKVNLSKLIAQTFVDKDLTETIGKHFKNAKVTKYLSTQYGLEFSTKEEASKIFNEEIVTIDGNKLIFNYLYAEKSNIKHDAAEIPEVITKKPEEPKPEPEPIVVKETVKAGVKRSNCESSSDEEEEIIKKTKMSDGTEAGKKVEKKVLTPKKSIVAGKTPEKKVSTPQNNNKENVKKDNKSPANGKAHFNKSPKQINKQSPAGNKGKNSPGNKKQFNKK